MQIAVFSDDRDFAASLASLLRGDGHAVTVTADDPLRDPTIPERHDLLMLHMGAAAVESPGTASSSQQRGMMPPAIVLVPAAVAGGVVGYASDDVVLLPLPLQLAQLRARLARFAEQRQQGHVPA